MATPKSSATTTAPKPPPPLTEAEKKALQQNLDLRVVLNNAYAALEATKATQGFTAFSFEEAMDRQIERIEGKPPGGRSNLLERVAKIEQDLLKTVESVRGKKDYELTPQRPPADVNTAEEYVDEEEDV